MKILKSFSSSLFNNVLLKWIARTRWINLKAWIIYLGRRTHLVGYTNISLEWVYFLFPQNSGGVFLFILILYLMTTNLKCVEDSNIMEKYKGVKSTQIQCHFATSFLVSTFTSILLNPVTLYIRCCYLQCVYSAIWCFCSSRCRTTVMEMFIGTGGCAWVSGTQAPPSAVTAALVPGNIIVNKLNEAPWPWGSWQPLRSMWVLFYMLKLRKTWFT